MILKTDGSLWACVRKYSGQLCDGTTTDRITPVQLMTGVAAVSAGFVHTMILKTDGSLWACGRNSNGQLGDGTTTDRSTPVQVMTGVAAVSAGDYHAMILKTDGSLWACGSNYYGQLCDGTNVSRYTPVQISESDGSGPVVGPDDFTDLSQYANIVYLEAATASPESTVTVPVKMKNAQANIAGFQFDLVLPAGVTVAKDEDGFLLIDLSTARTTTKKHVVTAQQQADGSTRVVCYSNNNYTFSGTSGDVLELTLQVAANAAIGEQSIKLRDVVMTTPNLDSYEVPWVVTPFTIEDYMKGDVNGDKQVNVVDVAGVVNLILNSGNISQLNRKAADINGDDAINVVDVAGVVNIILGNTAARPKTPTRADGQPLLYFNAYPVEQGQTITLPIMLDGKSDNFTGCQFDLYLPEGLSVAEEDGFPLVDIGSGTTTKKHTVSMTYQPDGALRVVCYSNNNSTFSGEEILTVAIHAAANAPIGSALAALRNITLSRPDVTGVTLDDFENELFISILDGIENIAVAPASDAAPVFTLSGQRLAAPCKGVNIVGRKKIVVK